MDRTFLQSWKHLKVRNHSELLEPGRLKKVLKGRSPGLPSVMVAGMLAILLFVLAINLAFLAITTPEERETFILIGAVFLLLSGICVYGVVRFRKTMHRDTVRNYLKDPDGFEVVTGQMVSYQYMSGQSRATSRMVVKVEGKDEKGLAFSLSEDFETDEWPFTTDEEENSLQPGDDWYEDIGKRKKLPVPLYLIRHKKGVLGTAIIGIDAQNLIYGSFATR